MKTDETDIDKSCVNIEAETSQPFSHKNEVWLRFFFFHKIVQIYLKKNKIFDFQIVF